MFDQRNYESSWLFYLRRTARILSPFGNYLFRLIVITVLFSGAALTQDKPKIQTRNQTAGGREMTILVTAYPHGEKEHQTAAKLQNNDFAVLENKRSQRIISVRSAIESPIDLAIVVQDNLDWRVNREITVLKDFIRSLPQGSEVMTAYLTTGGAIVTQELTTDRGQAAESLRIPRGVSFSSGFSPYDGVQTVLRHFEEKSTRRKMVLLVSDGLDLSSGFLYASPYFSPSLDQVVKEAQRRSIAVFTLYTSTEDRRPYGRFAVNYGQASLIRLSDETGGESYIGLDFVNFAPFLEEFRETLLRQWLITYRSTTAGNKFRRIEVTTDFDIHLHHPSGYEPLKAK
jgi:hypothetical protein